MEDGTTGSSLYLATFCPCLGSSSVLKVEERPDPAGEVDVLVDG